MVQKIFKISTIFSSFEKIWTQVFGGVFPTISNKNLCNRNFSIQINFCIENDFRFLNEFETYLTKSCIFLRIYADPARVQGILLHSSSAELKVIPTHRGLRAETRLTVYRPLTITFSSAEEE